MATKQNFGGAWTVEKLNILSDYLNFYVTALKNQPFNLIYIDAFAGTGKIKIGNDEEYEEIDGSAKLALQARETFSKYIFIEKKKQFYDELQEMVNRDFSDRAHLVKTYNRDSNVVLLDICENEDWSKNRAVLFLDPYAAKVKWETLQAVAATGAIDVWYLFPFSAANRMMKREGEIDPSWVKKLNSIFGDESWKEEFYHDNPQLSMFEEVNKIKNVSTESLKKYIEARLRTIFPCVSERSRVLFNSRNSPLFLFCFAVSNMNRKAQFLALKGADYILTKTMDGNM